MTLETGSLILADYTAKIKDTGAIIDTTRKEDAEKAGNADPTRTYEPRLIAVGEGWVLKGLDEALQSAEPGQTLDVELPPEKAFGSRDPNRVSRIPIRKFGDKASELSIGAEVEVDNRVGIVRSLESGRAILDFNHKYAGKTLVYNVDIKQKLETRESKVEALVRRRLPIEKEKLKIDLVGESEVKVTIPSDYFLLEGLQIIKRGISTDLFKYIKPVERVVFVEDYENPAAKPPTTAGEGEKKAEGEQLPSTESGEEQPQAGAKQEEEQKAAATSSGTS
ncbi:MAG TPA: FKBP-type peptidyl-prolyl cis-trans isomerase [Nitrososphaerales archaeon]|nr:FKBP-type peptidyl-prolyl cis-trans isomerase [Nitrososphaerales archaeon]